MEIYIFFLTSSPGDSYVFLSLWTTNLLEQVAYIVDSYSSNFSGYDFFHI